MPQRYFAEPYQFIPPYPSTRWCRIAAPFWHWQLRLLQHVHRIEFRGVELLQASIAQKHGILLTPNHSRWADASVMGQLSVACRHHFYYLVSSHLLRGKRWQSTLLNRLGSYSILREGSDLEALRASSKILTSADRPLVIFPEGTWFRQNDRVGPMQEGVTLIARQAAKAADRTVVMHPVAIQYWLLKDASAAMHHRLGNVERRFSLRPGPANDLLNRIDRIVSAFLAVKEVDLVGHNNPGTQDERIEKLVLEYLQQLEARFSKEERIGHPLARIRWLRQRLVPQLEENPEQRASAIQALDDLLFCENLHAHSYAYLHGDPTPERQAEALQRLEETLFDRDEVPITPLGATVEVLPALKVSDYPKQRGRDRTGEDPLLTAVRTAIQSRLDAARKQGPPSGWIG